MRARAVVARDLRELRARKQALDQPATEQESASLAAVPQSIHNSPAEEAVQEEISTNIQEPVDNVKLEETQDAPAPIDDQKPKLESLDNFSFSQQPANAESQPASEKPQDATQPQTQAGQEAIISIDQSANIESPEAQTKPQVVPKQEDVEAPAAAETNDDMNYESLFGPEGAHDNHPDLNFDDFDFGPDNTASEQVQSQDFAHNDAQMDLSTFGDHTQQQQQFSNDDVSSMLQGLETYANQAPDEGGDVDMLGGGDVGDGNDNVAAGGEAGAEGNQVMGGGPGAAGHDEFGMSGTDLDLAMGMGANETSFDDLLDGMDFGGGGEGEGGELEGQEFDDAFFGIGES